MENLFYVKKKAFSYELIKLSENDSIRLASKEAGIRMKVALKKFAKCQVMLKSVGYKGNYNDRFGEIVKLLPPQLAKEAVGFSLKIVDKNALLELSNEIKAEVTLYKLPENKKNDFKESGAPKEKDELDL